MIDCVLVRSRRSSLGWYLYDGISLCYSLLWTGSYRCAWLLVSLTLSSTYYYDLVCSYAVYICFRFFLWLNFSGYTWYYAPLCVDYWWLQLLALVEAWSCISHSSVQWQKYGECKTAEQIHSGVHNQDIKVVRRLDIVFIVFITRCLDSKWWLKSDGQTAECIALPTAWVDLPVQFLLWTK